MHLHVFEVLSGKVKQSNGCGWQCWLGTPLLSLWPYWLGAEESLVKCCKCLFHCEHPKTMWKQVLQLTEPLKGRGGVIRESRELCCWTCTINFLGCVCTMHTIGYSLVYHSGPVLSIRNRNFQNGPSNGTNTFWVKGWRVLDWTAGLLPRKVERWVTWNVCGHRLLCASHCQGCLMFWKLVWVQPGKLR